MKIECGVCGKEFEMDKAVAFAFSPEQYELIVICSEKCIKDYTEKIAHLLRIKIIKEGEK